MGGGVPGKKIIVSCLEWLTCLFLFIMVEFEKSRLKNGTHFLATKVFQRGTGSNE